MTVTDFISMCVFFLILHFTILLTTDRLRDDIAALSTQVAELKATPTP